jgi:prepilin-type N-terminal cleavage/methylation domain-containing protein
MRSRERRRARWADAGGDAGFSLLETVVAVVLVGVVMASISAFLITSVSVTSQQSGIKGAIQTSDDATELVRALKGSALLTGRDSASVDVQWAAPTTGVSGYLSTMAKAWDTTAGSGSGATAPLPTTAKSMTVNGVTYYQNWYVGRCWQPDAGGDCGAATGDVPFFRVVVAVTWSEKHCPNALCSYVTTTLVSSAPRDPLFNANETAVAPTVSNPGNQTGQVAVADSLQLAASGGAVPLTWTATGLPTGLSIGTTGLISGTPTASGSFAVVVRATDGFGLFGDAAFTWTINPGVQVTTPSNRTGEVGLAVMSLQIVASGGTTPYSWSATGLPPGLSINSSGRISGTPTAAGTYSSVMVTVTDALTGTATTNAFTWTIAAPVAVASPITAQTSADGTAVSIQAAPSGGVSPYTWSISSLPPGLAMDSAGRISGTPTQGSRWLTTLTVTDAVGGSASVTVPWRVTSTQLDILDPNGDRTDARGSSVAISSNSNGSTSGRTWSLTGQPPGVSIANNGNISGTVNTAGTYITTVTVVRSGETASFTFRWIVQ